MRKTCILTWMLGRERKPDDSEPLGPELFAIKRRFSKNHAASIHLNLICLGVTLWHGWILASKLSF